MNEKSFISEILYHISDEKRYKKQYNEYNRKREWLRKLNTAELQTHLIEIKSSCAYSKAKNNIVLGVFIASIFIGVWKYFFKILYLVLSNSDTTDVLNPVYMLIIIIAMAITACFSIIIYFNLRNYRALYRNMLIIEEIIEERKNNE
ncbi:MAG: hypothetical protein ACTTIO_05015 [Candidatus Fimenecus sp.]